MPARVQRIVPPQSRAGAFRQRVDIRKPSETLDSRGQRTGADIVLCRQWPCEIVSPSGTELEQARQVFPATSHIVRGWWRQGDAVTTRHFLRWGSRTLYVGHVRQIANQRGLVELLCGEAAE